MASIILLISRHGGRLYHASETQLIYTISIIPFIALFIMIYTYGVNIPFFDDWAFVDMIDRYLSGNLTFLDIWAQHNEHRPVTMKLLTLVSASLTNWNLVYGMMFSGFVAFLTFVVIAFQISRTFRILKIGGYGLLILFSALSLAGLSQYENWMWGIAVHWFLANFLAVSSFVLLLNPSGGFPCFALAAVCAVLSFMSMGQGFLALLLGLITLFLQPEPDGILSPGKWIKVSVWVAITALFALIYHTGYTKPEHHPSLGSFLSQPMDFLIYVCAYTASSLLRDFELLAIALGTISLVMFLIVLVICLCKMRGNILYYRSFMPWISISMYAMGTDFVTAISRLGFGWEHALTGRYTTMSALFYVALVVIVWGLMKDFESERRASRNGRSVEFAANVVVSVMMALSIFSSIRMFHHFPDFREKRLAAMETLVNSADRNKLLLIFPDAEYVIQKNEILKRHSLAFYNQ